MKSNFGFLVLLVLSTTSEEVLGREAWLERDGKAVRLHPRRFGQEHPPAIQKIDRACPPAVCGTLAVNAITPLLAAQPECSQQDMADSIIEASKQFNTTTAAAMVAAAIEYRQAEKNTPEDFTKYPPALRNSVFCQKAPKNPELNGLVQAQDPANDPNLFFDPATNKTVLKGSQANTAPFGSAAASQASVTAGAASTVTGTHSVPSNSSTACQVTITVTVTANATAAATVTGSEGTPGITAAPSASPASVPAGVSFGSCSVPKIEFGKGFDNRKETSFQPADKKSYNHGSAQNIAIITQFICDTLTNSCKANQAAKDLCANATQAAAVAPNQTGAQADAFNGVCGIKTAFAAVPVVNDQGQTISSGTAATVTASSGVATSATGTPAAVGSSGIGNFSKCSIPQIEFGAGFDGRKETSFQPTNKTSFNHGSAQNIAIITQFICDTLTNSCGADQTAKNTCAKGQAAASAAPAGTGTQADRFNLAFGIQTNFTSVTPRDNQGNPVNATSQTSMAGATTSTSGTPPAATPSSNHNTNTSSTSGNLQT